MGGLGEFFQKILGDMSILFPIGLMLVCGLLFGRLAKKISLPNVTGYLVAGLVLGPYVLGIVSKDMASSLSMVSEMALGFIALSIGAEFKLSYFKEVGAAPVVIAILEGLLASACVTGGLLLLGNDVKLALVLGAIASATAPAATIMVIRQYNAKGPVTKTLLSVVALDDAVALIAFGFAVAIATALSGVGGSVVSAILEPFKELGLSIVVGAFFAFAMKIPLRFFKKQSNRLCAIVGFVFLTSAISTKLGASSLLSCMIFGALLANISKDADEVFGISDTVTPPIFMLFFVVSGAQLDVTLIPKIGVIGVAYMLLRVAGKIGGATLGSAIMKADRKVTKYLGWTLVPQAGVAIGLTLVADRVVPEFAPQIRAVVLCGTLIYELTGPVISKIALTKAGEIEPAAKAKKSKKKA